MQLRGYADASYASHINGKSQYTACFDIVDAAVTPISDPLTRAFNTGMFYFRTWMAPTVDLNTCEAELGSYTELVKDGIYFRGMLDDMHLPQLQPTPMGNDNEAAQSLTTAFSGKTKRVRYMLPKIHWLIEKFMAGVFKFIHMSSAELPADFGTKRTSGTAFVEGRARTMGL